MKRNKFIALLIGIPFIGKLVAKPKPEPTFRTGEIFSIKVQRPYTSQTIMIAKHPERLAEFYADTMYDRVMANPEEYKVILPSHYDNAIYNCGGPHPDSLLK